MLPAEQLAVDQLRFLSRLHSQGCTSNRSKQQPPLMKQDTRSKKNKQNRIHTTCMNSDKQHYFTYSQSLTGGGRSPMVVSVKVDQYNDLRYFLVTDANGPTGSGYPQLPLKFSALEIM